MPGKVMTKKTDAFQELLSLMKLEQIEVNLFRGVSRDIGTERVFGGQVLAQAVLAASETVEDLTIHSLHAYFLRAGDHNAPIVYNVDRSRDGRSFSARRVVAIQHGRPIFTLAASFQVKEEGLEHQFEMPEVPAPESLNHIFENGTNQWRKGPETNHRLVELQSDAERPLRETLDQLMVQAPRAE